MAKNTRKTWQKCITLVDKKNKSLAHLIAQCDIREITDTTVTLCTVFPFYQEKIMQMPNRTIIEHALQEAFGRPLKISVEIREKEKSQSSELLSYAQQLMGGTATL